MKNFSIILFEEYEPLDVFGPVEVIGKLEDKYQLEFFSQNGGIVSCSMNIKIETLPFSKMPDGGVILIPGGMGTRREINNESLINFLNDKASKAEYVLTVCTGSVLLAKTNLINSRKATSNKLAFDWVAAQNEKVNWTRKARWVHDGKFYTSSGISAGIDMTIGFVSDTEGKDTALKIARRLEYVWNEDNENDPFC